MDKHIEGADNLDHQDCLGRTILHVACMNNWEDGVYDLLQNCANPAARTIYGSLPLHYAAATASVHICRMLLEKREAFDINATDKAGHTACDYAVDNGSWTIVAMLEKTTAKKPSSHQSIGETASSVSELSPPNSPIRRTTPSASEMHGIALVVPHDATPREPAMTVYEYTWVPNSDLDPSSSSAERPDARKTINPIHADSTLTSNGNILPSNRNSSTIGDQTNHVLQEPRHPYQYLQEGRWVWRWEP
jgi:hypothetical protein